MRLVAVTAFLGRPETDVARVAAMTTLGNGLLLADHHEDALRFLLQNQALYDSLFVEGQLDESRLRDVIANFRRGPRR